MEDKDLKNKINKFLGDNENTEEENVVVIPSTKDGLIERVDKTFITEDGRQLL